MTGQNKKNGRLRYYVNRCLLALLSVIISTACAVSGIYLVDNYVIIKADQDNNSDIVYSDTNDEKITKVSTATVAATGDLFMQMPIITNAKTDDGYNFDSIFTYFSKYIKKVDYTVANLETTLCGNEDGYKYKGSPQFNCPDEIIDAVKKAGFDMMLTANNHSYDTRYKGMLRTLEVIDNKGLDRLGIVKSEDEKHYVIKSINNIKLGMICYTYETDKDEDEVVLNGISLSDDAKKLINTFNVKELDTFYDKISGQINDIKADGAQAVVLYIHWGDEYSLEENKTQREIAQKMCDLGVDVILGSHPHVVEPIELLSSSIDDSHKTVCVYSLGNAVSNQRKEKMNMKTGHTEDGLLFGLTFAKYSDGTVRLDKVEALPLWVNMFESSVYDATVYQIIPLDINIEDWKEAFDLTDKSEKSSKDSYERTMKIIGEGLQEVNDYLNSIENAYPPSESTTK